MRKVILLSLLVLSIVLVGFLGNRGFSRRAQTRALPEIQPSPTPEILPSGWHRYTDKAAGYTISYPSNVQIIISRDKALEFPQVYLLLPPSTGRGNQWMTILVLRNIEKLPPLQFIAQDIQETFRGDKTMQGPPKRIYLRSQEAFQVEISPFLPGVYVFNQDQDKVYFLALHADMLSGLPPTPGAREMFFKIAATFTLLNDEKR